MLRLLYGFLRGSQNLSRYQNLKFGDTKKKLYEIDENNFYEVSPSLNVFLLYTVTENKYCTLSQINPCDFEIHICFL